MPEHRLLRLGLKGREMPAEQRPPCNLGSGHTVTALYEVVPASRRVALTPVDPLKYQIPASLPDQPSDELCTVKLRYKEPQGNSSRRLVFVVKDSGKELARAAPISSLPPPSRRLG